ncbi:MAG: LD-carboxypeptidase [Rickettsiella sp.]|nr:LD-carboxypeptidase [Rickettsiella sp.]
MENLSYKAWQPLTKGASIDIIAPAGGCEWNTLDQVKTLLKNWGLKPRISSNLFGDDLLCANTDEERFAQLKKALFNSESRAIWCLRGGYGCTRLIPELLKLKAPEANKLFIGFSDITALHLFLQQKWYWQTLHGPSANQVAYESIDSACTNELKKIIFGELKQLTFSLLPLNKITNFSTLIAPITGGTLTLIQTSLGTPWQIDAKNKILFFEEVNEPAYRIDRMLQHLQQSGLFQQVKAILFGDFTFTAKSSSHAPDHLIQFILKRFAKAQPFPVLNIPGIGHGKTNRSLPLGTKADIDLNKNQLTIKITG